MKRKKNPPDQSRKARAELNRQKRLSRGYVNRHSERARMEPFNQESK